MTLAFTAIVASIMLMFSFASPGVADPLEDAVAAYKRGDYATALRFYHLAAGQGDASGELGLGAMYEEGQGVPQNHSEAAKWYRLAADQGLAIAQYNLALKYAKGQGVPQNFAEAAKWLRLAADQGHAEAEYFLAVMYGEGQGVPQNYAEAAKWYRLATDQGHAEAQFNLGVMYAKSQGVQQSYAEALKWFRLAAGKGDAKAQYNLGFLYAHGQGLPQNYAEAAKWFRLAADRGHVEAQFKLGLAYYLGYGLPKNDVSAYLWLSLSAAQGHQDALKMRDTVAGEMTAAYLAEAQKQAAKWRPKTANAAPNITPRSPSPKKPEAAATSGTAFLVSENGEALTNAHVVEGCREIRADGMVAQLLARDSTNDLALIRTGLHRAQWSSWRFSVRQGEDIVAYGFPLPGVLSSGGNVVAGNVTALAGLSDDSRFLQISAPVQPGNSGGPLFDRYGNVVGVIVSKLNALRIASDTGDIPQNVNFAIKASVAVLFLDAQRVTHSDQQGAGILSTPDIAARAQALAVQVVCYK